MYDFIDEYEKQSKILKEQERVCQNQLTSLQGELSGLQNCASSESWMIDSLKKRIFQRERPLYILIKQREFLRPDTQEDFDYRLDIYYNFAQLFKKVMPDDVPFRFHGTSIYYAKEIIQSGEISCSQDRLGYATSHDLSGHISVVTKDNIEVTISNYIDICDFCMPAGCIFALLPSEEDGIIQRDDQMKKVDFKRNPDTLWAIITTPENISRVKEWCVESGIDPDVVCDFHSFLNKKFGNEGASFQRKKQIIKN